MVVPEVLDETRSSQRSSLCAALRIVVVDDDPASADILALVLRREGHVVTRFSSAESALEHLRAIPADLLLTDLVMPEMTGRLLVDAARSVAPSLRCFIMTGHDVAVEEPCDVTWVQKPIDIDDLVGQLDER